MKIEYSGILHDIDSFFKAVNDQVTCASHSGCDSCVCVSHSGCDSCVCVAHSGCDSCVCVAHSGNRLQNYKSRKKYSVVQFQTTEQCNHNCIYCFNPYRGNETHQYRATESIDKTVEKLSKITDWLVLTGGEPFSHPSNLLASVLAAKKYGINTITINTNGTLLRKNLLKKLRELDNKIFLFVAVPSVDQDYYTKITGNKSTYKNLFKGLRDAIEVLGEKNIATNIVLTKENWSNLYKTAAVLHAIGIRNFRYSFLSPAKDSKSIEVTQSDLIDSFYSELRKIRDEFEWASFNSAHAFPLCRIPVDFIDSKYSIVKCNMGDSTISIDIKNMVTSCPEFPSDKYGVKLDDLVNGKADVLKAAECLPTDEYQSSICTNCKLLNYCGAGCPATRYQYTGSPIGIEVLARLMTDREVMEKLKAIESVYFEKREILFTKSDNRYGVILDGSVIHDLYVDDEFVSGFFKNITEENHYRLFAYSVNRIALRSAHGK